MKIKGFPSNIIYIYIFRNISSAAKGSMFTYFIEEEYFPLKKVHKD